MNLLNDFNSFKQSSNEKEERLLDQIEKLKRENKNITDKLYENEDNTNNLKRTNEQVEILKVLLFIYIYIFVFIQEQINTLTNDKTLLSKTVNELQVQLLTLKSKCDENNVLYNTSRQSEEKLKLLNNSLQKQVTDQQTDIFNLKKELDENKLNMTSHYNKIIDQV